MTLDKALEQEEELRRRYRAGGRGARAHRSRPRRWKGLARNAGKHAGGVVIAPSRAHRLHCRCTASRAATTLVTQFDKDDVEALGLVKFDFLGLRTLTIIDWAVKTINAERAA